MQIWRGIIKRVVQNGAVIKDAEGLTELLVPWEVDVLYKVDKTKMKVKTTDGPWSTKPEVKEGQYVALIANTEAFPQDPDQVAGINLTAFIRLKGFPANDDFQPPEVLVIYHDFKGEGGKGNNGKQFATAVKHRYESTFKTTVHLVHAAVSYDQTVMQLTALTGRPINRIIIATHGNAGQLWLGNPEDIRFEYVVATPAMGKAFVSPQAFGAKLNELFGPGLSISICSCYLAAEGGHVMLQDLCDAANSLFLYAGLGEVFLHPSTSGKSTAVSDAPVVCFRAGEPPVKLRGKDAKHLPLFIF